MTSKIFAKVLKNVTQDIKSGATKAIKEGAVFSCQMAEIKAAEKDNTIYPEMNDVDSWLNTMFSEEFKPKVLNAKALESMKAKGITPPKQPHEILLIIVAGSESHVHLGISIPEDMELDRENLLKELVGERKYVVETTGKYSIVKYPHESPLKEKDEQFRQVFSFLKKSGLYVAEEESDDECYTFDD